MFDMLDEALVVLSGVKVLLDNWGVTPYLAGLLMLIVVIAFIRQFTGNKG